MLTIYFSLYATFASNTFSEDLLTMLNQMLTIKKNANANINEPYRLESQHQLVSYAKSGVTLDIARCRLIAMIQLYHGYYGNRLV